jgi:hypothetical protein
MKKSLFVSILCSLLIGWAAYAIARIADSPTVNRLVVVVMVASMFAGGFAVISGAWSAHRDAKRRGWRP